MKKLTTLLLVMVTSLLLTACGGGGGSESSDSRTPGDTAPGQTRLSWTAPSTRTDSSYLPLSDVEGFRVYYGTSSSDLVLLVDINDNSLTEYTTDVLPSGSYFFAVTAYDTEGNESGFSNVINKDV